MLVELNFRYIGPAKHFLGDLDKKALAKLWARLRDKGKFRKFFYNVGVRRFKVEFDKVKHNPNYMMPLDEYGYKHTKVYRIIYFYKVSLMENPPNA